MLFSSAMFIHDSGQCLPNGAKRTVA
jgi:hypothetical protein